MTPIAAGTPDPAPALNKLNQSLNKLRKSLNSSSPTQHAHSPQNPRDLSLQHKRLLSETVAVKMAHDLLIDNVAQCRQKIRDDQAELLRARLRLHNLSYERDVLNRKIAACRDTSTPLLLRTAISIPPALLQPGESDTATVTRLFSTTMTAFNAQVAARRDARANVDNALAATAAKRRRLASARAAVSDLAAAVAQVERVVAPVRALIAPDASAVAHAALPDRLARLPSALYVLARQALAHTHAFGPHVTVAIVDEDTCTEGEEDGEMRVDVESDNLYAGCGTEVRLDVQAEGVGPKLRIWFRYLSKLKIVVVRSTMVVDDKESAEYPSKELQALYPCDYGNQCPNAACGYLEDGNFRFNVEKAGGRAYVWANCLCGVDCLPEVVGRVDDEAGLWVKEMLGMMGQMRFKNVVQTLQQRVVAIVSLKKQIDDLMAKRVAVSPAQLGMEWEVSARIEGLERLSRDDRRWKNSDEDNSSEGWCMAVCGRRGLRVECVFEIEADYPLRRPVVRLKCLGGPQMDETELSVVEREVTAVELSGDVRGRVELALGAQVTMLLRYVDEMERRQ